MKTLPLENLSYLKELSYNCLLDLATDDGINASARDEAFGCIFGRDSAITILKILNIHSKQPQSNFLEICKRTLFTLISLQGREINLESGEEPGKFIHEFRRDKYEHLVNRDRPWYIYKDGFLRNYDSVDSTALTLIAIYKFWKQTGDNEFLLRALSSVEAGLNWMITYGDKDKDFFLEYELPILRKHGGLFVQSWTDSLYSLLRQDGTFPKYPIAAVEVQAVSWLAMRLWAGFYEKQHPVFGKKLFSYAKDMKRVFAEQFLLTDNNLLFAAQALDGTKKQVPTITGNPLLCLWATYEEEGKKEAIIEKDVIDQFVKRAFLSDLFDENAGIRTMSTMSPTFDPTHTSYHNGSFWPILNGLIHEGLETWNYTDEADLLKTATLIPIQHFGTPIELYIRDKSGSFLEYMSSYGKKGCRYQAWSAAATLDLLT